MIWNWWLIEFNLKKLYFITLNYAQNYILQPKLLEFTISTLNYIPYYTLHPAINSVVILDGIM